uniref:E4 protein n=1 Tax=Human papillomavirus TaxID=10566 RepID=A0A385PIX0_9PAPI|nr:MAG: E4 protein [Human papillomavirus]
MTRTTYFLIPIGLKFIIRMMKKSGIKYLVRLIMMDCIILRLMEVKVIFYCSLRMPKDLVKLIPGLCTIKMKQFIFLLPALLGGLVLTPRSAPTPNLRTPPGTPHPHRRLTDEQRNKVRRAVLGLPKGTQRSDDEDEEKENQQQVQKEEEYSLVEDLVAQLLKTWGQAIDQLQEQISQDLRGFKQRLGIRN